MQTSSVFNDPQLCQGLIQRLQDEMERYGKPLRFMEVCGTHTVSMFRSGLRSLLPQGVSHISGPGCPVCVTHDSEVAAFLDAAEKDNVIIATFGDLMRVPGPDGRSLKHAQAEGARIKVVYSPLEAVELAKQYPADVVVFLGVGFETTAPAVAGAVLVAEQEKIDNFCLLSCHKLVPPALRVLLEEECQRPSGIDAFLLPGHVALILGLEPFGFIARQYHLPAVVGGFEAADILAALCMMAEQLANGTPDIGNAYSRVVDQQGNAHARAIMERVFIVQEACWRGLGQIPHSGLALTPQYAQFDAFARLDIHLGKGGTIPGCRCGEVLRGRMTPSECPLFGKICTPQNPTGPCMVSTEGSCAAWYAYAGQSALS